MAGTDYDVILRDLLTRPAQEIVTVRDQARQVVYGNATSISALSQNVTWARDDAKVILDLANKALANLALPVAERPDPASLRPLLGHSMRFDNRCTWGP